MGESRRSWRRGRYLIRGVLPLALAGGLAIGLVEYQLSALNDQVIEQHKAAKLADAGAAAERYAAFAASVYGERSAHFASAIAWLGALQLERGAYREAQPHLTRYVAMAERLYGPHDERYAVALEWLGDLRRKQGRYSEAERLIQGSLDIYEKLLGPEHANVGRALSRLAILYQDQGRYAAAEPLLQRDLAISQRAFGADHPKVAGVLGNLAELYSKQARYTEAEALNRRALAIRQSALGSEHRDVALSLNNLALVLSAQGRYAEAESLRSSVVRGYEQAYGPEHPLVATVLNNLAALYAEQGKYPEAEQLHDRALSIRQRALSLDHPDVAMSLNNLAQVKSEQGRYLEAEALHKRSLQIREKSPGADHPDVALALQNLAVVYHELGRYAEAEPLVKRAIAIKEQALGSGHPSVATSLNNLAALFSAQERYADAENLHKRALVIREAAFGPLHPDLAFSLGELGLVYKRQRRLSEAEPLLRRAIEIRKSALGAGHVQTAHAINNLASVLQDLGRSDEAEALYRTSLATVQAAFGQEHNLAGTVLNNLGLLNARRGRHDEAKVALQLSRQILEKSKGADHPALGPPLTNLAVVHLDQQNWSEAEGLFREAAEIAIRRARRGDDTKSLDEARQSRTEIARASASFAALIKTVRRLAAIDPARAAKLGREMFQTAQWARSSEAASAVAKMAARTAKEPALAALIRERQDLVQEWHARDRLLVTALAKPQPTRVPAVEEQHRARMSAIDARLAEIDKMIADDHQQFAAVESLEPLSVTEVQDLIGPDETLIMILDTQELGPLPEETFLWVVTKTAARWLRIEPGTRALVDRMMTLRCGLDRAAWLGQGATACAERLHLTVARDPAKQGQLPFNLEAAFELYRVLFADAEDLIKEKHLLIVASSPLMFLPFHVLVTEPPILNQSEPDEAYRSASWLGHRQPLSVLPAVSSLKALRQHARESGAVKPYVGFGNPLLLGDPANGEDKAAAELAAKTVKCAATVDGSASLGVTRTATRRPPSFQTATPDELRRQVPLPETADELCTVATSLGASDGDVYLGPRATESAIKAASASGDLARYRIVHFATHAALAGQVAGVTEPGLILHSTGQSVDRGRRIPLSF